MDALILTAERAEALGFTGPGPFTLGGAFPGEFLVDEPLAIRYMGFADVDDAQAAFDAAFGDLDDDQVPLLWTEVGEGEGLPIRTNHALSEDEISGAVVADAVDGEAGGRISTHAEADAVAAELGIEWPEGSKLKLAEKVQAIESFRAAGSADEMTPAPGAEDTTPGEGEAGRSTASTAPTDEEEPA